ncbi:hypothetical protein DFP72DRAFT_853202 [Ephemerocybe angulata]|uniref:CCHC-type domain-containing protein n=1 Tax=Ephemerocybe angulata TaxID=980116 RepID=A0A8H6LYJ0_9AGAR|nr:hypothetical protein DFP72DRAFT_853202 [Tulosesus angulatus]
MARASKSDNYHFLRVLSTHHSGSIAEEPQLKVVPESGSIRILFEVSVDTTVVVTRRVRAKQPEFEAKSRPMRYGYVPSHWVYEERQSQYPLTRWDRRLRCSSGMVTTSPARAPRPLSKTSRDGRQSTGARELGRLVRAAHTQIETIIGHQPCAERSPRDSPMISIAPLIPWHPSELLRSLSGQKRSPRTIKLTAWANEWVSRHLAKVYAYPSSSLVKTQAVRPGFENLVGIYTDFPFCSYSFPSYLEVSDTLSLQSIDPLKAWKKVYLLRDSIKSEVDYSKLPLRELRKVQRQAKAERDAAAIAKRPTSKPPSPTFIGALSFPGLNPLPLNPDPPRPPSSGHNSLSDSQEVDNLLVPDFTTSDSGGTVSSSSENRSPSKSPETYIPGSFATPPQTPPPQPKKPLKKRGKRNNKKKMGDNVAGGKARMPAPYGKNHPTYDPEEPGSAVRFFDEVEMAANEAGLKDEHAQVIKWALLYLPDSVRKRWGQLTLKANNAQRTFVEWRAEVMKILPRRAQEEAGALARLDALVTKWSRDPITRHDRAAFYDFSLGFTAEAKAVKDAVSNRELVRMYLRCLTPIFRERLQEKLTPRTGAGVSEEDPYLWTDVVDKSRELVTGGTTGPFGDLGAEPSVSEYSRIKIESRDVPLGGSRAVENIKVKQEEMESNFQNLYSKLDVMGVQMKEILSKYETSGKNESVAPSIFQQGIIPPRQSQSHFTQRPRQGLYTRPASNPFNTPPRICYYCHVEGHMLMACPTLDNDKASGRVVQQGYNIYVNNRQLSKDSPDGLSMKQRADAILAGTYNPPANVNMLTAEDWGTLEENTMIFLQSEPDVVTSSVLQQSIEKLRSETQGAMHGMANHIISSLRSSQTPAVPSVQSYPLTGKLGGTGV